MAAVGFLCRSTQPTSDRSTQPTGDCDHTDWKDYIVSVQTLEDNLEEDETESGLAYDFLSNLPTDIQETVEGRNKEEILQWINANFLTAPLFASSEGDNLADEFTLNTISSDTAVGHDGFVEHNILNPDFIKSSSPAQISITEINVVKTSFTETSISKDGSAKIHVTESNLPEDSITKVSPFHITVLRKNTFINTRSDKFSKAQISFNEATPIKIGVAEVGFSIDTTFNSLVSSINSSKATSSEIFFSPSVLSNQFFSIHDSTPQVLGFMLQPNLQLLLRGC